MEDKLLGRINDRMYELRLNQARLAEKTGLSQSTISHAIRRVNTLSLRNVLKILDALGIELEVKE